LCFLVIGMAASARVGNRKRDVRTPTPGDEARVRAAVQRLAVQADVPSPDIAVVGDRIALSWTIGLPWRTPTIHVTTELLDPAGR
jgi:Zn-dependent protease with chaperone function